MMPKFFLKVFLFLVLSSGVFANTTQDCRFDGRLRQVVVSLPAPALGKILVQVAESRQQQRQGLMFRDVLPAGCGMLFVWDQPTQGAFWMKNTPLSLDLLFLDARGVIVAIIERAVPYSENLLVADSPYRAVLEVVAGTVSRLGLKKGMVLSWD